MKRVLLPLIIALSIHAVFLSIKINISPKPEIQSKPEPIQITMFYRQIEKKNKRVTVIPKNRLENQKPKIQKTMVLKPKPIIKQQQTITKKNITNIKPQPVKKKQLEQNNFIKNRVKKVLKIKEPEQKIKPKTEIKPTPKPTAKPMVNPMPEQAKIPEQLPQAPDKLITPKQKSEPELLADRNIDKKDKLFFHENKPITAVIHTKAIPKYKTNPKLVYPRIAKKRGYHGKVLLLVVVSKTGTVEKITISKSSGHSILDKTACKAVQQWLFYPGTKDGKPVEMSVTIPIQFNLKS